MSMHKIPLTPLEEEGLRLHGLPIGTPSQRSDTFRQGVAWAVGEAKRLTEENEKLRMDAARYRWLRDAGATFYTGGPEITDGSDKVHVCEFAMDAAIDAARRHCAILPCSCK